VRALLAEARIGMAGPQTAIGDAIGVAVKMSQPPQGASSAKERVLVLLTDGNDTASRLPPEKAAEIAKQAGITIHTVAIGDPDGTGENRVDLVALGKIAAATGGRAFRAEDRAKLEEIYAAIDTLAPDQAKRTLFRPRIDLYWMPLAAAMVLLAGYQAAAISLVAARARPQTQPRVTP
jgi:Ca-activated chloride channel family protein